MLVELTGRLGHRSVGGVQLVKRVIILFVPIHPFEHLLAVYFLRHQ